MSSQAARARSSRREDDPSGSVRIAAPYESDPALSVELGSRDDRAFISELRSRNQPMLLWSALVFNSLYLGWSLVDYVLVPERWLSFLILRLSCVALTSMTVAVASRPRFRKYSFEAFWLIVVIYLAFIAPMLPRTGDDFGKYMMGLSITMIGAGVIPVWHPRWPASSLLLGVGIGAAFFFPAWDGEPPPGEVVASGFVMITAVGLAVVASIFKYDLAKRDFRSRVQLASVARRESKARRILAETSGDLQGALSKLKELDRLKSRFFANISHELRTPLTMILAPLSELDAEVDGDRARQHVRVIRRNAERLLQLIDDLLDLSRLDAGGLRLNLAEVDVRTVAASVVENSLPAAAAEGVELRITTDRGASRIWGDAHRLEIVVTNLVSNAIKFTPGGGWIDVRVEDVGSGVTLEVEDSGSGISGKDLPRVFERFYQVDPSDRRRKGGVGIGLALAKELVELHGGTIDAASPGGGGTIFTVTLPFGRDHIRPEAVERRRESVEPPVRRRAEDLVDSAASTAIEGGETTTCERPAPDLDGPVLLAAGRKPRILVAEDNPEVREFIGALLADRFDVAMAEDGETAWEMVRTKVPDLVVSDVMMPNMSGTELCRVIKQDPALRAIPVILLTARVGSEATLEAYARGADDFVAKPFHPGVLIARIRAQLNLRTLAMQVAQQEKLAAVGTMSAGILHEVRNPVNAILNASRALGSGRIDEETGRQLLQVIGEAAVRIEGITSALDAHARPAEAGETVSCDLKEGIEATLRLVGHRLNGVAVNRNYETEHPARAPAGSMNQVLLNLIDNALRVEARNLWLDLRFEDGMIVTTIADDGPGISNEDADRIFDPFFTKRPQGDGTGLGLYLSRRMVEEAGGALTAGERPGGGALFTMVVPALLLDTEPGRAPWNA